MFTNDLLKKIKFETNFKKIDQLTKTNLNIIFDENILNFFGKLSDKIFERKDIRKYPDLASYAFFCRKKNVLKLKKKYNGFIENRYGRGVSLHFAPSNVPLNFAYSLFFGLISGNSCIIRISENQSNQSKILINQINNLFKIKNFFSIKKRIIILKYSKNKYITDILSKICDVRIIWGGDESIDEIRNSPLKPTAFDVTFADKYSISIVGCNEYIESKNKMKEAISFFNDTLFFDQNACTSPKVICWIGNKKDVKEARRLFWRYFEKVTIQKKYKPGGNVAYEKFYKETLLSIDQKVKLDQNNQNTKKILLNKIPNNFEKYFSAGGIFLEFHSTNLKNLKKVMTNKVQTITYLNINPMQIVKSLELKKVKGGDRIVMNGRSSDIGLEWDGYDIIFQISKKLIII